MPKGKKKGKKGGKGEEESGKKKEEILTLFLKDKLQKEERNSNVNLLKLNEGWRSILRQTRVSELREDIDVLMQTFNRKLDSLNGVIKSLERDLYGAERQWAQAARSHLQHVEQLWAHQEKNLKVAQHQWEDSLQHLSSIYYSERTQIQTHTQQQRSDLEDAKFIVEQQHEDVMKDIQSLYRECIAAYENAHEDQMAALVVDGVTTLREKNRQQQETVKLHQEEAKEVEELVLKNQQNVELRDRNMRRVKRLQESVFQLRMKLKSSKTEKEAVERDLTSARDQVNQRTLQLRHQLTRGQTAARKQLTDLTLQSNAATRKLETVITKGEKVLRVGEMCRKLENEQKIIISSSPSAPLRSRAEDGVIEEFASLWRLTRRINVAQLQRDALKKRREDVSRENQQLRVLLRQHLDAMTVSHQAVDRQETLLNMPEAPKATPSPGRCHTVIEAAHIIKHAQ